MQWVALRFLSPNCLDSLIPQDNFSALFLVLASEIINDTSYECVWRLLTGIFYYACGRMAHIYITSSTWYFVWKTKVEDIRQPWLFPQFSVPRTPGSKRSWYRYSGFAEQMGRVGFIKCSGTKEDTFCTGKSAVNLSSSTYGNLNLNSAFAAWKWNRHILRQITLIKFRYIGRRNISIWKSLFTGMFIQPLVA